MAARGKTMGLPHGEGGASHNTLSQLCISRFEDLVAQNTTTIVELLQNRLADFRLWADSVGALSKPGASLDSRLKSRRNDLELVKGILIMLCDFLQYYYLRNAKADSRHDLCNVDAAISNLAMIGTAIRRTGKASRHRRADRTYRPDDHKSSGLISSA